MKENGRIVYEGDGQQFVCHLDKEKQYILICLMVHGKAFSSEKNIPAIHTALSKIEGLKFFSNDNVQSIMFCELEDNESHIEIRYYTEGADIGQFVEVTFKVFEALEELGAEEIGSI